MSQSSARRLTKGGRPFPTPRAARGPRKGRRQPEVDRRADSKVFLFKKKKSCARLAVGFFFPPLLLLSSSPLPPLPFESFFFFFSPEFDRMADSTSVSINFFFFSSSFK